MLFFLCPSSLGLKHPGRRVTTKTREKFRRNRPANRHAHLLLAPEPIHFGLHARALVAFRVISFQIRVANLFKFFKKIKTNL